MKPTIKEGQGRDNLIEKYFCFDCPYCELNNEFIEYVASTACAVYCVHCRQKIEFEEDEEYE